MTTETVHPMVMKAARAMCLLEVANRGGGFNTRWYFGEDRYIAEAQAALTACGALECLEALVQARAELAQPYMGNPIQVGPVLTIIDKAIAKARDVSSADQVYGSASHAASPLNAPEVLTDRTDKPCAGEMPAITSIPSSALRDPDSLVYFAKKYGRQCYAAGEARAMNALRHAIHLLSSIADNARSPLLSQIGELGVTQSSLVEALKYSIKQVPELGDAPCVKAALRAAGEEL